MLTNTTLNVQKNSLANKAALFTDYRPYMDIDVKSVDKSVDFYATLFNHSPVERDEQHALFELNNPPLTLRLELNDEATRYDGHFGVQMKYVKDIQGIRERMNNNSFPVELEESEAGCCFSVASKVWINDPDKNQIEVYVLIENNATEVRCDDSCACEADGC